MGVGLHRLSLAVAGLLGLAACSPFALLNVKIGGDDYTVQSDIPYGPHRRHVLDVYVPKKRDGPAPVVVFFYGGSWQNGERADYRFAADGLASRGYITILPDYRLYPEVRFPAFIEDGAKAVAWAFDHAAELGGDPQRVFLMGHSAGAHIAAMLALDERYLAAVGVDAHRIRGVISVAGPLSFYPSRTASIAAVFAHLADETVARPIVYVDGAEAPLLLLHGGDDDTVFLYNTINIEKAVRDAGGRVRKILYPGVGHIGILLALSRPFRTIAPVLDDAAAFIDGQ